MELSNQPRDNFYEDSDKARETWTNELPLPGYETGQHRPPKRKEIRQFVNMFCYNHPKNMDHKKHCNEGKIMLAVKKIFFFVF